MLFCSSLLLAIDEFELDLTFLQELSRIEFNDYAEMQLGQMQKKYPEQKDLINLEKARIFYTVGRSKDADTALKAIPKNSPLAGEVLLLQAQVFAARKQWPEAAKVYKEYFAKNQQPASNKKSDANKFKQAVMIYNYVLKSMNKPAEAAKVLELLANIKGAVDERQMEFLKLQTAIDNEENKLKSSGKIDDKALAAAIKGLENLQFIRDGVAAAGAVQLARSYIIRGRGKLLPLLPKEKEKAKDIGKIDDFANAVKAIDMITPRLEELAKMQGLENSPKSPLVEAMYYKAIAFASHAVTTYAKGETDKAKVQIRGAAKYLEKLLDEYPDSAFQNQAITEHDACSKFSEAKFGEKLELKQSGSAAIVSASLEKADAFLQQKNYQSAFQPCLEALRLGRTGKRVPEVGLRLVMCLAEMDDLNGADALLDYLSAVAPRAEGTADAALRFGVMLWTKAQNEKKPSLKTEYEGRALSAFDKFVDAAPSHPKASEIAFTVAENAFAQASRLAERANQAANASDKAKAHEEAQAAFRSAIPKYQRMVEVFGTFPTGVRSQYKLAWCYDSVGEREKAIEYFLNYFESESNPRYANDRLQAKFQGAYLLIYSDHPLDAVGHFEQLQKVLSDKDSGFDLKSEVAGRLREDCLSFLPWAYDLAAERYRPEMTVAKNRRKVLQDRIKAFEETIAQGQAEQEQAKLSLNSLDENLAALQNSYAEMLLDFTALATQQIEAVSEDMAKMSEAEKQVHRQTLQSSIIKRIADLEVQKKNELVGNNLTQEKRAADAVQEKAKIEKRLARLNDEAKEISERIAELKKRGQESAAQAVALRKAQEDADKALTLADSERQAAQELKSQMESRVDDAKGKEKENLQKELDQLAEAATKMNELFQAAFVRQKEASSEQTQAEIRNLERAVVELAEDVTAAEAEALRVKNDLALAKIEAQIVEAEQLAAGKTLSLNRVYGGILEKAVAERKTSQDELKRAIEAAFQAEDARKKLLSEKIAVRGEYLAQRAENSRAGIAAASKILEEVTAGNEPTKKEFDSLKSKAVEGFGKFLQQHPSSKAPENMSRLGSIYLFDIEDPVKASDVLRRLAAEFPKDPATQKALFMLGRAQAENGNLEEAAKAFEKLLGKPEEIALANLYYVSDICLKAGLPIPASVANREILKRADDPKHPDAPAITRGQKERASFALGQSLASNKRYAEAIKILEGILAANERSNFFFEIKFILAEAKANIDPPDWAGLEQDLYDVMMFATSPLMRNQASCLYADAILKSNDPSKRNAALSNYQIVLLADPKIPENRELIERALVGSAKLYSLAGEQEKVNEMVKRYKTLFSGGKYLAEISRLAN
ncbi:MAG: tetratricopeptide repeat protein [Oligosphaeraceae bacterium]|nr:tetratricopeptide repeat protein [Oligosphaeraceae bacterium]